MTDALPLAGHEAAEQCFLAAFQCGRLHHAWLIEGPHGIGKARLALRLAALVLGARGPGGRLLGAGADDPVMQTLFAGSHPDFRCLSPGVTDRGKPALDISVDQVRALTDFFALQPALSGWRAAIIDAADDLNRSAANALLKTLEEPGARSILFLVSHGRRPLLPTIRSRCRRLRLRPLDPDAMRSALAGLGIEPTPSDLAMGRPGRALRRASEAAKAGEAAAEAILGDFPRQTDSLQGAALSRAGESAASADAFADAVLAYLARRAETDPTAATRWLAIARAAGEAEVLNTDPLQRAARIVAALYENL